MATRSGEFTLIKDDDDDDDVGWEWDGSAFVISWVGGLRNPN